MVNGIRKQRSNSCITTYVEAMLNSDISAFKII